ncbi:MAG: exodeoxyribonuclease VII small subunit [Verrucomicrobiota bacterium]
MAKTSAKTQPSFEDSLNLLEELVSSMENDQLPLETLLSSYEKGNELLKNCQSLLDNARKRIEVIRVESENKLASDTPDSKTPSSEDVPPDDSRLL